MKNLPHSRLHLAWHAARLFLGMEPTGPWGHPGHQFELMPDPRLDTLQAFSLSD